MWDFTRTTSHGGNPLRRIFSCALTVIITAFLWTLVTAPTTFAADASWTTAASMGYDGNTYGGPAEKAMADNLNFARDFKIYTFSDPASANPRKIRVIYFEPGIDISNATTAKYKTYIIKPATGPSNPFDNP